MREGDGWIFLTGSLAKGGLHKGPTQIFAVPEICLGDPRIV